MPDKVSAHELLTELRGLRGDLTCLREMLIFNQQRVVNDRLASLVQSTAALFGVSPASIITERRAPGSKHTTNARALVAWALVRHMGYTIQAAGDTLHRDHSTISHALTKVQGWQGSLGQIRDTMAGRFAASGLAAYNKLGG